MVGGVAMILSNSSSTELGEGVVLRTRGLLCDADGTVRPVEVSALMASSLGREGGLGREVDDWPRGRGLGLDLRSSAGGSAASSAITCSISASSVLGEQVSSSTGEGARARDDLELKDVYIIKHQYHLII